MLNLLPIMRAFAGSFECANNYVVSTFKQKRMRRALANTTSLLVLVSLGQLCVAATKVCHSNLWPITHNFIKSRTVITPILYAQMIVQANKSAAMPVNPIKHLISSGVSKANDPRLLASRRAFKNSDNTALLAIAYRITDKPFYLQQVKKILLAWARINQPNGNPINTSRISGLFWAYDLVRCQFSQTEQEHVEQWLASNAQHLRSWHFGKITKDNNYRTHQLKSLLLIDRILGNQQGEQTDKVMAIKHSNINIDAKSGKTLDYSQRDALYYQNFNLQPWIEIVLLSNCCRVPVTKAFYFLAMRILSNNFGGEFLHSTTTFDSLRAKSGFSYARKGGKFNVESAIPTMIAFETLSQKPLLPALHHHIIDSRKTPWIIFLLLRQTLWSKHDP